MDRILTLLNRCMALLRAKKLDADLDEELRAHLDLAITANVMAGMTPEQARVAALRAFGGVAQTREAYRTQRGLPWIEQVSRDIRFSLRGLRKSPGFSFTAIVTLALGIGAVTSVFSVVDAILLKPFDFRDPNRLVVLREAEEDSTGRSAIPCNYRHIQRLKSSARTIEDIATFGQRGESVSPNGEHPRIVGTVFSSPNLFSLLAVRPILGRGFVEADARQGAAPVVILSYEGWQTLLGGNPNAVGQILRIGGDPHTVIGVLPAGMRFPQISLAPSLVFQESTRNALLFQPLIPSEDDLKTDMGNFNYKAIARLKPGVTLAQASAELESLQNAYTISARLPLHFGISLVPLTKDVASGISGALWLMFAAVGAVLLIACVNLANLQLARAVNAEREIAVRAALGASKTQLVRSRLTESLLLAIAGGLAGSGLAIVGTELFLALVPASVPRLDEVRVNMPVLLFAAGISILSAVAFGILPALRSIQVHPQAALQSNSTRTVNTQEGNRIRSLMVAAQVASTVVLLMVTSLVLRSFAHLMNENRGFDTSHVTLAQVDLFSTQYGDNNPNFKTAKLAFVDRTLAALRQLPGVQSAGITSVAPLTGETWVDTLSRPDHPVPRGKEPLINVRWVDPEYMPTMQSHLVEGRNFIADDRANPYVALLSERTAREGFPGENPIGRKITKLVPDDDHPITVVGVMADARINGLKDDAAMVYMPYWAYTPWTVSFLVRSSQPGSALISEIQRVVWQIDPQVAIPILKSMDDEVSDSAATERFQAIVLTTFGAAALLLALLGVYGVLAYSVSLRRQEFGIRIALGSDKGTLIRLVLHEAAHPVCLGCGVGLGFAALALRWVRSLLYQTPLIDPLSIGGSLCLIAIAAALAAIIPARRAASIDPMRALRTD